MSRKLKFKVYNTRLKCLVYYIEIGEVIGASANNGKHGITYSEAPNAGYIDAKDCVTLQFTGLKDQNGTDIYEGDTVQYHPNGTYAKTGKIIFENGAFVFDGLKSARGFVALHSLSTSAQGWLKALRMIGHISE